MKAGFAVCALWISGGLLFAQDATSRQKLDLPKAPTLVMVKTLPDKGTLVMQVNVGGVNIVRSDMEKTIRLTIDPKAFYDDATQITQTRFIHRVPTIDPKAFYDDATVKSWVRRFDVAGDRAWIDLKLPDHGNNGNHHHSSPEITIAVPAQTDLKLELGVGQLTVKGVEGNKELHVGIGELDVGLSDASQYHEIQTSSKLGEADDDTSNQHSGGFFPKTHHTSVQGPYKLHATVGIGQVNVARNANER
ncbi:MAG TPA: hypothetical protein VFA02_02245 [Pseudacidobacterium sp.]|nr:hypothetical protein [Pseudacidobacterium sp.]